MVFILYEAGDSNFLNPILTAILMASETLPAWDFFIYYQKLVFLSPRK
jgi:hypothetical protein